MKISPTTPTTPRITRIWVTCLSREVEFFELVDRKLFPLTLFYCRNVFEEEALHYIPVILRDFPYEDMGPMDLNNLRLGWKLLLILSGVDKSDELNLIDDNQIEIPELAELAARFSQEKLDLQHEKLDQLCQSQSENNPVIAYLPLAIQRIYHNTGCDLLDIDEESWSCLSMNWSGKLKLSRPCLMIIQQRMRYYQSRSASGLAGSSPIEHFKEIVLISKKLLLR